jgi:hypothetical protein
MENQIQIKNNPEYGSFRDPSGSLFYYEGALYRRINNVYEKNYAEFIKSGLYEKLLEKQLIIPHEEISVSFFDIPDKSGIFKIIKPELIPFISYPHEWCFGQLKDAAILTLEIQKIALSCGMTLKDSSAYNIQFKNGKPILIDTLSFECLREGEPWSAYRQFCQHFLAPLALQSKKDLRLSGLFRVFIDGIPLDLASALLPLDTYRSLSLLSHIHLHAKAQKKYADKAISAKQAHFNIKSFHALIDHLMRSVLSLNIKKQATEWDDYYSRTNYIPDSFDEKRGMLSIFLEIARPQTVWDLGANTGIFSRVASEKGIDTIAFDIDANAVDQNYNEIKKKGEKLILPLVMDLANPSGGMGWANKERKSLAERGPADMALALALVHHLAIGNNVPFEKIASFFSALSGWLAIEFVPKEDSNAMRLLASRPDILTDYCEKNFESEFSAYYSIEKKQAIPGSLRTLYLMKKR